MQGLVKRNSYRRIGMAKSDGAQLELLSQCFEGLSDLQGTKNRKHKLTELIVICLCEYFGSEGTNRNRTLGVRQGGLPSSLLEIAKRNSFTRQLPSYAGRSWIGSFSGVFSGMVSSMC